MPRHELLRGAKSLDVTAGELGAQPAAVARRRDPPGSAMRACRPRVTTRVVLMPPELPADGVQLAATRLSAAAARPSAATAPHAVRQIAARRAAAARTTVRRVGPWLRGCLRGCSTAAGSKRDPGDCLRPTSPCAFAIKPSEPEVRCPERGASLQGGPACRSGVHAAAATLGMLLHVDQPPLRSP
jgi:hypothetical protein